MNAGFTLDFRSAKTGFNQVKEEKCKQLNKNTICPRIVFVGPFPKGLVEEIVCYNLISITGKSLIRQRRTSVMPVIKEDSEVSCRLYEDPKWDSIHSVS